MAAFYRLDLNYNGADFSGWQSQPDGAGVQDCLESALATILQTKTRVVGASRTDAGVHARLQVATFEGSEDIDCYRMLASMNALLPISVGVRAIAPCAADFHPIASAVAKVYCYRFWLGRSRDAAWEHYVHHVSAQFQVERFVEAIGAFEGTHDFSAFCAVDAGAKTRVRRIRAVTTRRRGPLFEFWLLGDGFLKQMVRIMAGTALDAALGKITPSAIAEIIAAKDRSLAGATAPAKGLCLENIYYEEPLARSDWARLVYP